jgi:hypothetical protein
MILVGPDVGLGLTVRIISGLVYKGWSDTVFVEPNDGLALAESDLVLVRPNVGLALAGFDMALVGPDITLG